MPGMYGAGDYDLAGFAVGAVERTDVLPRDVRPGGIRRINICKTPFTFTDTIIGLASSGVHSNGYSLVRFLVQKEGLDYEKEAPFAKGHRLGDILLKPTKIYVKSCLAAIKAGGVKALAHITGGGIPVRFITRKLRNLTIMQENLPRVLPKGVVAEIEINWPILPVFKWLLTAGSILHFLSVKFSCIT